MSKSIRIAAAILAASVAVPVAAAPQPAELSSTALTQVQTHTYSVPAKVAFAAVLGTLQSQGYMDVNADKDAGTVSAQTESKGKIFYNILWGFGKKKMTQKASLLVEEGANGQSTVRLNLQLAETKARGIFGTSFSDGKLVKYADPYNEFFAALDSEIAKRVPVASPAVATEVTAPATAGTAN